MTGTALGTATASLACSGVTVRFGGLVAVDDVDLAVPPGEIVGLVGPNGAGKSTLFGALSGLIRPSAGRIELGGEEVTHASPQARADRGLARTFQHPELFAGLTVREHLVLAHRSSHTKSRIWSDLFVLGSLRPASPDEQALVGDLVASLGLSRVADQPALGLPLGVARLVELGRALATAPRVLLLDEPSSGLDSMESAEFEHTLRRVTADNGTSVLLVEHDVELVMRLCSTISVLDFGVLIARGTADEIRRDPAVRTAYLGDEGAPSKSAAAARSSGSDGSPSPGNGSPPPVLAVEDLCVRYGDAVAVAGATFSVPAGGALAVLGPNGAGKSSLARGISGLVPPSSGRVELVGRDIAGRAPHRIRRAGLVYLPEGRGVFRDLSVMDNLRMAVAEHRGRRAKQAGLDRAFEIFPVLAERRRQTAGQLSGGEQQMLSLARVFAALPKLVIADELSLGLAPKLVEVVFEALGRARASGVTVVMIEQYVHRAIEFADRCLVLQRGAVVWQGPADTMGADAVRHYLGDSVAAEYSSSDEQHSRQEKA